MAGAIAVAAVLSARLVKITCPHCGQVQQVERKAAPHRTCLRCRGHFPDPIAARKR